ncbi:hypothetical protein [Haloarchaeobius sp. DFWS5]|uniref:hypothetical protein n=1 Tax=Haloarchaeobius sp. DFWS5 TaxID=3446114 RepID=UPI003EC0AE28
MGGTHSTAGFLVSTVERAPTHFDVAWYIRSLFSTYNEVHAFELGLFGGIVLAALLLGGYRGFASVVLVGLFVFALGFPDGEWLCSSAVDNCSARPVQGKPWYFMSGLFLMVTLLPGVARRLFAPATPVRRNSTSDHAEDTDTGNDGRQRARVSFDDQSQDADSRQGSPSTLPDGCGCRDDE